MQWLLLAFGIIGRGSDTTCMKLSDGTWGSVSFMYHGGTGCNHIRQFDLYGGLRVSLLRCSGGMRGMKSLCAGSGLKSGV